MLLKDFRPKPNLVVQSTKVVKPRYPVIDAHNHLGETFGGGWVNRPVNQLLDLLDQADVKTLVDLDGGWGEDILYRHLDYFKAAAPDRFMHFGGVDWNKWPDHGNKFGEWAAQNFRKQVKRGAEGLKIWKALGLKVLDHKGNLVRVDDQRLAPLWETAAELGLPVIIHVADPVAFFDPLDHTNERWEELQAHPDWHFPSPKFPAFTTIMDQMAALVKRHQTTIFIGAHVGCYGENLDWVGNLLDECPNYYIDISARLGELGRQPYSARKFFIKYQDRILFGSDMSPDLDMYRLYYRVLETDDEYFNYSTGDYPIQGRWHVYGLYLPDEVLEKVYLENAWRVLEIEQ